MTTNYVFLGSGTTDSNGVAKLDHDANGDPISHSYTGSGVGEVDVVASLDDPNSISDSSLQSETYGLWDTILYDVINGYKNTNISVGTGITETDNGEYYTLSSNQANSATGRYIYSTDITGDFEATFELNITYNSSWAFYFGARTTEDSTTRVYVTGWKYFKFRRVNGVCTAYISSDNENWSEMTMYNDNVGSATCKFQLYIYTSATETARTVDFKNLKVYSI